MTGRAPTLAVRNVSKSFGGVAAVQDVSFTVSGGEVVALAGENGAGKSTVKNLIGGILRPDAGQVEFGGAGPAAGTGGARHSGVATVHQETSLFPDLTVAENILIGRLRTGRSPVVRPGRLRRIAAPSSSGSEPASAPTRWCGTWPPGSANSSRSPRRSPPTRAPSSSTSRPPR